MPYRIKADESVPEGVIRIVCEQIDRAIAELTDEDLDCHEGVHQARKRFKKIRAVARLVRSELGEVYQQENTWFRDAGRRLSEVRDAEAMIETFDKLYGVFKNQLRKTKFKAIREALVRRRQRIADQEVDLERQAAELTAALEEAKCRVQMWPLTNQGFTALRPNLQKTYGRGRKALGLAYEQSAPENFHEWRKRVKYHWYHSRFLENVWPEIMPAYQQSLKTLADLLGDEHDLVVLRETLLNDPDSFGGERDLQALLGLVERRQTELRTRAEPLGQRLFAEKPRAMGRRLERYWEAWRSEVQRSAPLAR